MAGDQRNIFFGLLKSVLRPVVRFCLRHSLKLQDFVDAGKLVFLEEAQAEFARAGAAQSNSRLSVMTGVHRRDIIALRKGELLLEKPRDLLSKIIGQWQSDKRFCQKGLKPKTLLVEGRESEFTELVFSVSQDLNPYTVLFELERSGAIKRSGNKVSLISRVYHPKAANDVFALLAKDSEDLICAVEENIFDEPAVRNLQIRTEYDNIVLSATEQIRTWLLREGSIFQEKVRKYLAQYDKDLNRNLADKEGGVKVMLATFSRVIPGLSKE